MPTFIGTNQEFKRYMGPRLRNFVQMITKKHKAIVGACEHCGSEGDLESAHIKGRDRNQIIDLLLPASSAAAEVTVDLRQFEKNFKLEHEPVEKAILVLCQQCHIKYDTASDRPNPLGLVLANQLDRAASEMESPVGLLPMTLEPPQAAEFKRRLLASRRAQITIFYSNGHIEHRQWDASNFSESSTVMGNLRSRPEFRQGTWQRNGIVKVHIKIISVET